MAIVYILYSSSIDKFYVGSTELSIEDRLKNHNDIYYDNKFTSKGIPWEVFWHKEVNSRTISEKIEKHIKMAKSTVYIKNLVKYPEIIDKLILKYS